MKRWQENIANNCGATNWRSTPKCLYLDLWSPWLLPCLSACASVSITMFKKRLFYSKNSRIISQRQQGNELNMKQNLRPFLRCDWVFCGEQIMFHCCECLLANVCDLLRVLKTSEKYTTCKCNCYRRAIVGKVLHGDKWNKQTSKQYENVRREFYGWKLLCALFFNALPYSQGALFLSSSLLKSTYIDSKFVISELLTLCVNNKIQK